MILIFVLATLITSCSLLLFKRDRESGLICITCLCLCLNIVVACLFIAKKGGISHELQALLFLNSEIKTAFQYKMITLDQLGFFMAFARYTFPYFFILLAWYYSMSRQIKKFKMMPTILCVIPFLTLVMYYPSVFDYCTDQFGVPYQIIMVHFSRYWIVAYVAVALILMLIEYKSITIHFFKQNFFQKIMLMVSFAMLYLLYGMQDPAQVYQFYRDTYMSSMQIWYFSPKINEVSYHVSLVFSVIFIVVGFSSLLKYTQLNYQEDKNDVVMKRKFDTAGQGVSFFVHSIKNQLLSNRIVHRKIRELKTSDQLDEEALWKYITVLEETNEVMIIRMEELYNSVKSKSITLVNTELETIVSQSSDKFYKKYPEGKVKVITNHAHEVLADETHLSEAIYNLLINGWEATIAAGNHSPIEITIKEERNYTSLELRDCGLGISKDQMNKIFEPFYSNKNSNHNWGMGLYFVKTIIKSHFGVLRVDSDGSSYSSFLILLPRYDK